MPNRLLFFADVAAGDVGIDRLSIGCDRSLDEPGPVIRLRGSQEHTSADDFDLVCPALTEPQLRACAAALERLIKALPAGIPSAYEARDAFEVIQRAYEHAQERARLNRLLALMRPGEVLRLADEGTTTLYALAATPGMDVEWRIERWGAHVADVASVGEAAAVAQADLGLPRTDPVAGTVLA